MIDALIFDMNGVIIDDERVHKESWRQLCKLHNIHLTEEEFKQHVFGRTEKSIVRYLFQGTLTPKEEKMLIRKRVSMAISLFKPQLAPTKGLLSFLEQLRIAKIPLAVATGSGRTYADFILDGLTIRPYFQHIVTAEMVFNGKPDPEVYLLTASLLNANPRKCIVFEDSISGITAAQRAGMKVIAITTTHSAEELMIADNVISSFDNIEINNLQEQ